MGLSMPLAFFKDTMNTEESKNISCYIDGIRVSLKECGFEMESHKNISNLDYWAIECAENPNHSHCKMFDE